MFKFIFITSNHIKFLHFIYLGRKYDIGIARQEYTGIAYKEPRVNDRDTLLLQSIDDAKHRLLKYLKTKNGLLEDNYIKERRELNSIFFIEDSSVKIHCLSSDYDEIPGIHVKSWMQNNSFLDIDTMLKKQGNNRNVTVRSDIMLYIPPYMRDVENIEYKNFFSTMNGTITEKEFKIKTNKLYPWLDNKTFNKWFIPEGYTIPVSLLPVEEANGFDFRAKAFREMVKFLRVRNINHKK